MALNLWQPLRRGVQDADWCVHNRHVIIYLIPFQSDRVPYTAAAILKKSCIKICSCPSPDTDISLVFNTVGNVCQHSFATLCSMDYILTTLCHSVDEASETNILSKDSNTFFNSRVLTHSLVIGSPALFHWTTHGLLCGEGLYLWPAITNWAWINNSYTLILLEILNFHKTCFKMIYDLWV